MEFFSKDKRKIMWISARDVQHVKKRALPADHISKAAEKSDVKKDDNRQKLQRNLFSIGNIFFSKSPPRQQCLTVQARHPTQHL